MQQVLVEIPIPFLGKSIPIFGFGMMLFVTFVVCTWVMSRRARQEGIPSERIQDMALWIFFMGIVGARLTYFLGDEEGKKQSLLNFYRIWDGGLVFYGSIWGGAIGFFIAYQLFLKKYQISLAKHADMLAPAIALGICVGRLGCLLNGCCYGQVHAGHGPKLHFPLASPPSVELVKYGHDTSVGFTMVGRDERENRTVSAVAPSSPAHASGLRPGDVIIQADARAIGSFNDLEKYLTHEWPQGKQELQLIVKRGKEEIVVGPFSPRTVGLHPTQVYSSIGGFLIFLLLQAYYPLRRRAGEVMVLLMLTYPVERFLEEMLRRDNPPWSLGLTFSQNVSLYLFLAGLLVAVWVWWRQVHEPRAAAA